MATGQIVGVITDTLVSKGGQMVANALNLRASDPNEPSFMGMIDWQPADDPNGEEHQVVVGSHGGAAAFPEGGPLPAAGRSEKLDFKMPFASRYAVTIEATKTQLRKLELAERTQQNKITGFVDNEFSLAFADTYDEMEGHLHSNDPATGVADGFAGVNVVGQSDNVYGTIDANTYPVTGAVVNTNGGARPLTLDLMDAMDIAIRNAGGRYDTIITSREQVLNYTQLDGSAAANRGVGTIQQHMATDMAGAVRHFSAGFVSASYKGRQLLGFQGFPTDVMDFALRAALRGKILRNWEVDMRDEGEKIRWSLKFEALFFVWLRRKHYARLEALS